MAAISKIHSIALIVYNPKQAADAMLQTSFKIQRMDHRFLHQSIRIQIPLPRPAISQPKPFKGTCTQLVNKISATIHNTIDGMDFNGLRPYLKLIDQMEAGKPPATWKIDSQNEEHGSTCVGMSLSLLKNLRNQHGVKGSLAVQRKDRFHEFEHAAVIIECSDGLVLVDPRSNPEVRLFSIPFNSTVRCKHFSLTAAKKGEFPPLTSHYPESKAGSYELYMNATNGADIVAKHYMANAVSSFIPIAVYEKNGSAAKDIKIFLTHRKIVLKNHQTKKKQEISFDQIQTSGCFPEVAKFMSSDFHTAPETAYAHILRAVSQQSKIVQLFAHIQRS